MKNPELVSIKKGFASNKTTERLIEEIMVIRGASNRSQVIRDAVFEYRKSTKGLYLDESPTMAIKRKKITEAASLEAMTPHDYAAQVGAYTLLNAKDDKEYALVHEFASTGVRAWPLDELKARFAKDPQWLDIHLTKNKTTPIASIINIHDLLVLYGIIPTENISNEAKVADKSSNLSDS